MKNVCFLLCLVIALQFCIGAAIEPDVTYYTASQIEVLRGHTFKESKLLTKEQTDYMLSLWNGAEWETDNTRTMYDYKFTLDFDMHYASSLGLFNDPENMRHFYVTEEQRVYINRFILSNEDTNENNVLLWVCISVCVCLLATGTVICVRCSRKKKMK